jgi:hypothetical protein
MYRKNLTFTRYRTGLKFVLIRPFTREFVLLGGLKSVRFRGSRVFTRPKRTNFSPVPNSSGIPCKRGLRKASTQSCRLRCVFAIQHSSQLQVRMVSTNTLTDSRSQLICCFYFQDWCKIFYSCFCC